MIVMVTAAVGNLGVVRRRTRLRIPRRRVRLAGGNEGGTGGVPNFRHGSPSAVHERGGAEYHQCNNQAPLGQILPLIAIAKLA